ncbi:helix-turn-helix domain-containing protein [uncultured Brevibacillus sp.]|uniref:helix-turn-helix domain-containing protein n=1 Tax=uncultured Brevibacillus sp. TaxID=169970 RepID=UPI00259AA9A3|nr:helix-turn-helix domain-containing protein [uncultured Brevibacillus sp.]
MDKWQVYVEIDQLLKQGFTKRNIAKKLKISRTTLYRYLEKSPKEMVDWMESTKSRAKKLDKYEELILRWLREHPDMWGNKLKLTLELLHKKQPQGEM